MKNYTSMFLVITFAILLTGCGKKAPTALEVTSDFYTNLEKGNEVSQFISSSIIEEMGKDEFTKITLALTDKMNQKGGYSISVPFTESPVDENNTVIKGEFTYSDGDVEELEIPLIKVNDEWKINMFGYELLYSLSAENAVKEFYRRVERGDEAAIEVISNELIKAFGVNKFKKPFSEQKEKMAKKGGIASFDFQNKKVKDDSVTMDVVVTFKNGETQKEKIKMIQEDGQWKATISK